ncbi:MAG: hypothetical protein RLZZ381_76 [Cyanobacteriota bacterium]|jgi:integrase/recombinase XerC
MSDLASPIARLEASLSTKIGSSFNLDEVPDVIDLLLRSKRSPATRREYQKDLNKFFQAVAHEQPNRDLVLEFLQIIFRLGKVDEWSKSIGIQKS